MKHRIRQTRQLPTASAELTGDNWVATSNPLQILGGLLQVYVINDASSDSSLRYAVRRESEKQSILTGTTDNHSPTVDEILLHTPGNYYIDIECDKSRSRVSQQDPLPFSPPCKGRAILTWYREFGARTSN